MYNTSEILETKEKTKTVKIAIEKYRHKLFSILFKNTLTISIFGSHVKIRE